MDGKLQSPRQQRIFAHINFSLEEQNRHYEELIKELNQVFKKMINIIYILTH
jgi:hypothetical protein